jgi:hypothetical protein
MDIHNHFTMKTDKKVVILTWKCDSVYIRNDKRFEDLLEQSPRFGRISFNISFR